MQTHSAEALLLAVTDLQEKDRIVTFLTREHGKVRGVARGARRKYSRFSGQLQPLAKVKVTWFEKEGRELVRISGVELVRLPGPLQADLEGILLGSYLAEHLLEFAQENEPAELYFRLLDSTLAALASGVDRDLAARYFEAWVLRLAGIFPAPRECPSCGRAFGPAGAVLPAAGEGLICAGCAAGRRGGAGTGRDARAGRDAGPGRGAGPDELAEPGGFTMAGGAAPRGTAVGPDVIELLTRMGRESLPELAERPPAPAAVAGLETVTAQVRRGFLQRELRSHGVMHRTLQTT